MSIRFLSNSLRAFATTSGAWLHERPITSMSSRPSFGRPKLTSVRRQRRSRTHSLESRLRRTSCSDCRPAVAVLPKPSTPDVVLAAVQNVARG